MNEHECVCVFVWLESAHLYAHLYFLPLLKDVISQMNESVINYKEWHADKEGYT